MMLSGAFIIPFLVMMVLEGMPLLLLELGIGQKMRTGSYGVWNRVHPWLGGIGLGSTVVAIIVGCYYNIIIAWCLYYLFMSFKVRLKYQLLNQESSLDRAHSNFEQLKIFKDSKYCRVIV